MRILLVNVYSQNDDGRRTYREFREHLLKIITEQNENLEGKNYTLIEREKDELDEFLFDFNTSYTKKEAAKNFDILDLICVVGDVNILPWQKSAEKVLVLIKMCLRVKKWLFAAGFAMHALIYLSASNLEKPIRVLNGRGHGSKIGDLRQINVNSNSATHADYFLDHVTGDLYSYNPEYEEWVPFTNVGLHYARAAHEYNTIGKYVVKAPTHHSKASDIYNFTESAEILVILKKHEYGHWLLQNCSSEFAVSWKARWEIHSFSFLDKSKVFSILAESKTGPIIIEYDNIVGIQFDIRKRYPNTVLILRNFLYTKLRRYKELESKDQAFYGYIFKKNGNLRELRDKKATLGNTRGFKLHEEGVSNDSKRSTMLSFHSSNNNNARSVGSLVLSDKPFTHSGYASKQKGPLLVQQNNIASNRIQATKKPTREPSIQAKINDLKEKFKENCMSLNNLQNDSINSIEARFENRGMSRQRDGERYNDYHPQHGQSSNTSLSPGFQFQQPLPGNLPSSVIHKGEVRKSLYPSLRDEFVGQQKAWVPGNLSKNKQEQNRDKEVIRIKDAMYSTGVFFKKNTKLRNLTPSSTVQTLQQISPYMSPEDIRRKEEQENDKKILFGKFFQTTNKLKVKTSSNGLTDRPSTQGSTINKFECQSRRQGRGSEIYE